MAEFNGWQQGDKIGSGGQSTVYKARSPLRSEHRAASLASLQMLLDGAKLGQFADAIYSYSRPDLPNEIGALKVFHLRENSAQPIERLKREIEILKEGRPNLPRLLDANADESWMVTEYFSKGTLADYQDRYKGKAFEALKAFRGLVETVASLHEAGVVHRDIKPANIFVADNDRLVLGDFGLVYQTSASSGGRVTLQGERIGPWQHLPWWANRGGRVEDPTPAIDVFLLGNLLWCMVAGESEFPYGERFRHRVYNLEERFPQDAHMMLINLVLSQCLGEEENLCLKTATDVLAIVDEIIEAVETRRPLHDENNILVMPCRFCHGYYEIVDTPTGPGHVVLNLLNQTGVQIASTHYDILKCGLCSNVQIFGRNQPFDTMKVNRRLRINSRPRIGAKSPLRW